MIQLATAIYLEALYAQSRTVSRESVRDWYEGELERQRGGNVGSAKDAGIHKPGLPTTDVTAAAMCRGWNDFRTGYGVHKLYEKVDEVGQRNYELGRAMAAAVAKVHEVPPWPPQMTYDDLIQRGMISPAAHEALMVEHDFQLKDAKK